MKKILIVLGLFLFTGCSNKLVCTLQTFEENYESEINVVFEIKKDKIVNSYSTNTMTFNTKEDTQMYLKSLEVLDVGYAVAQKNDYQLELSVSKEYERYNKTKEEIIEEYKEKGYTCN